LIALNTITSKPADPTQTLWDVIIVGTGVGGGTLGYALAKAGKSVLFCERGSNNLARSGTLTANYAEQFGQEPGAVLTTESADLLANTGRFNEVVVDESGTHTRRFVPFVGSGSGGSSALYGMAFERFAESDFAPGISHPNNPESSLEAAWPVGYDAFSTYYSAAENLYRVHGTQDPLSAGAQRSRSLLQPPALTPAIAKLCDHFSAGGLHPYQLPLACDYVADCQCCQGFLCDKNCKNDSSRVCVQPAIQNFGAVMLDNCRVVRIHADKARVNRLACKWHGRDILLRGKQIVLAAGALQTPNLLLRSASIDWPNGVANSSGMVGRNLMRHCIDIYLIQTSRSDRGRSFDNRFKEFAFNDFYCVDGVKLGSVQSFGRLPPGQMLFGSLKQDIKDGPVPWMAGAFGLTSAVFQPFLQRMVDQSIAIATTMEDLPYLHNRVLPALDDAPEAVRISYNLHDSEKKRVALFRKMMARTLKSLHWRLIKQAENNQRIAHVCGTCRFGQDPQTSVLDPNNRCHDLENLYVVDSSFFPSSGGTNPGLTIAANALRVADHMLSSYPALQHTGPIRHEA